MPIGISSLLGLGLKFCIKMPRPTNKLKQTMKRFRRDVRTIYYHKYYPPPEDGELSYIPELYFKSDWEPLECKNNDIEEAMSAFESTLRTERARYCKPSPSNLLPCQWKLVDRYKDHNDFIAIEADKNLGGCFLHRDTYITRGVSEHLGNTSVYQPLTKRVAIIYQNKLRNKVKSFAAKWRGRGVLSKAERTYLHQAIESSPRQFARFRMSLKAHKTPWKMRPIVCCAGTFMNNLSCWLDYWLQKLKGFVPTYIQDSNHLLDPRPTASPWPAPTRCQGIHSRCQFNVY